MQDLYEDEFEAIWRYCGGKTNAESVSEFVAFANAVNASEQPPS